MKTAKALQRAKHWTHLELQNVGRMGCSVSKPRPSPGFSQLFRKGQHVCAHSLSFKQSNLWIFHHCLVNDTAGFSVTEPSLWKRSVVWLLPILKPDVTITERQLKTNVLVAGAPTSHAFINKYQQTSDIKTAHQPENLLRVTLSFSSRQAKHRRLWVPAMFLTPLLIMKFAFKTTAFY